FTFLAKDKKRSCSKDPSGQGRAASQTTGFCVAAKLVGARTKSRLRTSKCFIDQPRFGERQARQTLQKIVRQVDAHRLRRIQQNVALRITQNDVERRLADEGLRQGAESFRSLSGFL